MNATATKPSLSATDRCDRCGAQAYMRAELPSGLELMFCAHHGREHQQKLQQDNAKILDETARLHEPDAIG